MFVISTVVVGRPAAEVSESSVQYFYLWTFLEDCLVLTILMDTVH